MSVKFQGIIWSQSPVGVGITIDALIENKVNKEKLSELERFNRLTNDRGG